MAIRQHIRNQAEGGQADIEFPSERITTSSNVTEVGDCLYRLDTIALFVESASFRDVIEADRLEDGTLRFRRVVEKSGWRVIVHVVSKEFSESAEVASMLERVVGMGGHWEWALGGFLFVALPPNVDWDPMSDFKG